MWHIGTEISQENVTLIALFSHGFKKKKIIWYRYLIIIETKENRGAMNLYANL